jgi:hypothetical protein
MKGISALPGVPILGELSFSETRTLRRSTLVGVRFSELRRTRHVVFRGVIRLKL